MINKKVGLLKLKTKMEVNIDFDYASKMWQKNKKKLTNGCYEYKKCYTCKAKTKQNKNCKNKTSFDYCYLHE